MKVLIVDDAQFMRETIKTILRAEDITDLYEAVDGNMAIEVYKDCQPDVVLMDITMPNMNGIEALKAIREYDLNAKVIMVSAMGQESKIREAIVSGAVTFIVKPFQNETLIDAISKVASM